MYKIKIYKDLGFDNKNQRFFTYSDNFEPALLLKSLTCESVFNGARTTVDVKTTAAEFQNIFVYAHNIVIENEKQRPLFFYVQNVEQITRDTIRFYLEKDYFHTYFNNKFAGSVTGLQSAITNKYYRGAEAASCHFFHVLRRQKRCFRETQINNGQSDFLQRQRVTLWQYPTATHTRNKATRGCGGL